MANSLASFIAELKKHNRLVVILNTIAKEFFIRADNALNEKNYDQSEQLLNRAESLALFVEEMTQRFETKYAREFKAIESSRKN